LYSRSPYFGTKNLYICRRKFSSSIKVCIGCPKRRGLQIFKEFWKKESACRQAKEWHGGGEGENSQDIPE
jgi:hypothetical protein